MTGVYLIFINGSSYRQVESLKEILVEVKKWYDDRTVEGKIEIICDLPA